MSDQPRVYVSYVLRLWSAQSEMGVQWHAVLEHIPSGARHGFADLESLMEFLRTQTQLPPDSQVGSGQAIHDIAS
jgi:hypothetical protein